MKTFTTFLIALCLLLQGGSVSPIPVGPDWAFGSGSGTIQVNGSPVLYAGYGSTFSQDLGISPKQVQVWPGRPNYYKEGTYTLTFTVQEGIPSYPGYYHIEIDFGTQELGDCSGWGKMRAQQMTVTWPGTNYIVIDKSLPSGGLVQGDQNLTINGSVVGWTTLFSNFNLTFTPDAE